MVKERRSNNENKR